MKLLFLGVLLFCIVHLVPSAGAGFKQRVVGKAGEQGYKAIFGLLTLASLAMMVIGWKSSGEIEIYVAPEWGGLVTFVLMFCASVLLFAPYMPNNISRVLRHPQLTGIALFGIGHLAAVGNARTIALFGGFVVWSIIEIIAINRRDGVWTRPGAVGRMSDFKLFVAGLLFFLVFLFTHEGLFGVSAVPA